MSVLDRIIAGQIRKFDSLRRVFVRPDARCFLLFKDEFQKSDYAVIAELTGGFHFKFSEFFNSFRLKYATADAAFQDVSDTVTHIAFDGYVYVIPPENRVVIKPNGSKPYYQFFCRQTEPFEKFEPEV